LAEYPVQTVIQLSGQKRSHIQLTPIMGILVYHIEQLFVKTFLQGETAGERLPDHQAHLGRPCRTENAQGSAILSQPRSVEIWWKKSLVCAIMKSQ